MALTQYAKKSVPRLKTWFEAFAALREYLSGLSQQEPIVLFFDELPWMDTPKAISSQPSAIFGIHGPLWSLS